MLKWQRAAGREAIRDRNSPEKSGRNRDLLIPESQVSINPLPVAEQIGCVSSTAIPPSRPLTVPQKTHPRMGGTSMLLICAGPGNLQEAPGKATQRLERSCCTSRTFPKPFTTKYLRAIREAIRLRCHDMMLTDTRAGGTYLSKRPIGWQACPGECLGLSGTSRRQGAPTRPC